ncbi:DUF3515 domain-containing protein [Streptomyces sp. NPDC050610]|uniref:DUF3515 domain-containing protein n=1 Tax=Streptomyces sp. NPDC050610 TaxID=3157097 RepID=UPI0034226698
MEILNWANMSARRLPALLAAVVLTAALSGCSAADGSAVPAPTPSGEQAGPCRALHKKLPATVNGMKRRTTAPVSDFTAAWGDPPIVLRCGVNRPLVVTPGYKRYNPNADTVEIGGVEWLPERQPDGSIRCTTSKRQAWVEVTLPKKTVLDGDFGLFADLSDAVKETVPFGII